MLPLFKRFIGKFFNPTVKINCPTCSIETNKSILLLFGEGYAHHFEFDAESGTFTYDGALFKDVSSFAEVFKLFSGIKTRHSLYCEFDCSCGFNHTLRINEIGFGFEDKWTEIVEIPAWRIELSNREESAEFSYAETNVRLSKPFRTSLFKYAALYHTLAKLTLLQ